MKQAEQEFDPWSVFIIIESTYLKFAPLPGMQFSWLWPDSAQPEALISPFILGFIFLLLGIPHTFHHQLRPLLPHIFSSEQSLKSSLCCSQVSRSPIAFGGPSISSCFCPMCVFLTMCFFHLVYILWKFQPKLNPWAFLSITQISFNTLPFKSLGSWNAASF